MGKEGAADERKNEVRELVFSLPNGDKLSFRNQKIAFQRAEYEHQEGLIHSIAKFNFETQEDMRTSEKKSRLCIIDQLSKDKVKVRHPYFEYISWNKLEGFKTPIINHQVEKDASLFFSSQRIRCLFKRQMSSPFKKRAYSFDAQKTEEFCKVKLCDKTLLIVGKQGEIPTLFIKDLKTRANEQVPLPIDTDLSSMDVALFDRFILLSNGNELKVLEKENNYFREKNSFHFVQQITQIEAGRGENSDAISLVFKPDGEDNPKVVSLFTNRNKPTWKARIGNSCRNLKHQTIEEIWKKSSFKGSVVTKLTLTALKGSLHLIDQLEIAADLAARVAGIAIQAIFALAFLLGMLIMVIRPFLPTHL